MLACSTAGLEDQFTSSGLSGSGEGRGHYATQPKIGTYTSRSVAVGALVDEETKWYLRRQPSITPRLAGPHRSRTRSSTATEAAAPATRTHGLD